MNIRRFNLGTMLNLLEIDQHRSINAAARARDVSQPSLSRGLQAIEEALGVPLFTRTATGVEPTPYGDTLLYHTRIVQNELERCLQDIEERRKSGRTNLHVGGTPGVIGWLLTPAILGLLRDRDDVNATLTEAMPDDLWVQLQRGTIDLAISTPLKTSGDDAFTSLPLVREPTCMVAGPKHSLAGRQNLGLADLNAHRWVLPTGALDWQRRFEDEFHAAGVPPPTRIFTTNSFLALREVLVQTDSIALLPLGHVDVDLAAGTLRKLAVSHRFADVEYLAYMKRVNARPALVNSFIDRFQNRAGIRHTGYAIKT